MVKYACGRELHRERFLKFKSAAFDSAAPINLKTKSRNRTTIAIKSLITELQTRQSIESVAVYGAGMFGRKLVDACREAKIAVRFLYDRDPVKVGKSYDGLVCKPADEVVNAYNSTFLIGSADFAKQISIDIRTAFETAGLSNPKIIAYKEI